MTIAGQETCSPALRRDVAPFPRWTAIIPAYGMLAAATPLLYYQAAANWVGRSAGFIYVVVQLPILAAGIGLLPWLAHSRLMRVLVLTVCLSAASLAWSGGNVAPYGVEVVLSLVLVLAWSVIVAADPETTRRLARIGVALVLVALPMTVLNLLSSGAYSDRLVRYPVIAIALFSQLLWDMQRKKRGEKVSGASAFNYLVCLALLAGSTFRAVTLGATLGVGYALWKGRGFLTRVGVALALASIVVVASFAHASSIAIKPEADRTNLEGRYKSIPVDQFSGRLHIWEGTLNRLLHDSETMTIGVGLAATGRYVAEANPQIAGATEDHFWLHSHNTLLEMVLAMGIAGLALALLIALMVMRRLAVLRDPELWALWITIGFVALANVPAFDYFSGSVILLGLGFGSLLQRKRALSQEHTGRDAPEVPAGAPRAP